MAYRPVTRVVTVEFVKEKGRQAYEVRITPEIFDARHRDKIVWEIQGLPEKLANRVTVGGFELLGPPARVTQTPGGKLIPHGDRGFTKSVVGVGAAFKGTLKTDNAELGVYKYTIYFDGEPLIDPEGEIKGPRH
jgi:hypothetical protein